VLGFNPTREPIKVKQQVAYLQENMGFYREMNTRQSLGYIAALNGISTTAVRQSGAPQRRRRGSRSVSVLFAGACVQWISVI
jgi:ABC-type Na+ transport system ATPase subunit NatA